MTRFEEIKLMNETTIRYLNKIGKDTTRNEIINKILEDDACFFKREKEDACVILQDIGVSSNKTEELYNKLISKDEYYFLCERGKIKKEDPALIIKYESYDNNDLFKRKNSL